MKPRKTKAQRRIAVFRDAIKQINLENYSLKYGTYFYKYDLDHNGKDARKLLIKSPECSVCAMGAVLVSMVRCENRLTAAELTNHTDRVDNALRIFSRPQLDLIEEWYMGWNSSDEGTRFGNIKDRKEAAKLIFQNAIKNGGIFKPEQLKF